MTGLFRCVCGSFRWVPMDTVATAWQAPVCHAPMRFQWVVIVKAPEDGAKGGR